MPSMTAERVRFSVATPTAETDPVNLIMSVLQRDYAGAPWSGTASAGGSSGNSFVVPATFGEPDVTSLNSHGVADFVSGNFDKLHDSGLTVSTALSASGWWIFALVYIDAIDTNNATIWTNDAIVADSGNYVGIHLKSDGSIHAYGWDSAARVVSSTISTGQWVVIQAWHDGSNIFLQLDNAPPVMGDALGSFGATTGVISIGHGGTSGYFDGKIAMVGMRTTSPTVSERAGIYAHMRSRYFNETATGTLLSVGRTIAAGYATRSLTAQNVGLLVARKIAATQQSYGLFGQDAILRFGYPLDVANGVFTVAGQAAAGQAVHLVVANAGAFSASGQDLSLLAQRLLTVAYGIYTLAGQDLSFLAQFKLAAEFGAFAHDGQAELLAQFKLAAAYGTYALAGQAADVYRQLLLTATHGTYALVGQVVEVNHGLVLFADQDSVLISGQDSFRSIGLPVAAGGYGASMFPASLQKAAIMPGIQAAYSVVGQNATLRPAYHFVDSPTFFQVAGQVVGLLFGPKLAASHSSFAIVFPEVVVGPGYALEVETDSLAVAGQDTALVAPWRLTAAPGSFLVAGEALLGAGRLFGVQAGNLELAWQDSTIRTGRAFVIDQAVFSAAGQAASLEGDRLIVAAGRVLSLSSPKTVLEVAMAAVQAFFSLTGQDTTSGNVARLLEAGRGKVFCVGVVANLEGHRVFEALLGILALTSVGAILERPRQIPGVTGAFSIEESDGFFAVAPFIGVHGVTTMYLIYGVATDPRPPGRITMHVVPYTKIVTRVAAVTVISTRLNMSNPLEVGDYAAITIYFTSGLNGAYGNPTSGWQLVVQRIRDESGQEAVDDAPVIYVEGTDSEITQTATGKFLASIPCEVAGKYQYTVESEGPTLPGTKTGFFFVNSARAG